MSINHQELKGNSYQRRARKVYLLSETAGFGGNGATVPCSAHPNELLTYETLTSDRIVPGNHGGTYARNNVRPMCKHGNCSRQDRLNWKP